MLIAERPPIFILGNPRSGTTLLRLMLTCHHNIVIPPECGFAVWLYEKYRAWSGSVSLLDGFARDVMKCRKIETWGISLEGLRDFLIDRRPTSYAEAAALVYECYALTHGRSFKRWGDKNNFYLNHIETIDALYPSACFVHIIRDGRNVACSYKKLHELEARSPYAPNLPWRIEEIARQWHDNNERIKRALAELAAERVHQVRFEDLVTEPERQLRLLCSALGEAYDPRMLEYHRENRARQLEPAEMLAWKKKTLQPLIVTEVDRYRRELSDVERTTIEDIAADTLEHYGFLPDA